MNRLVIALCCLGVALATSCGGGNNLVNPLPAEPTIDLTVKIKISGVPLRELSVAEALASQIELKILQLKQGGRLIYPHEDPDYVWIGELVPLEDGEWHISELLAGQFILMQLKFAPGVSFTTGRPIPPGDNYIQKLQIPVVVPQLEHPRCSIDIQIKPDDVGGYYPVVIVTFDQAPPPG
jgi:hypothetical protein